ncbi:TIGR03560 family F420-dependent LLM class oxidoreductase [Pseudactinotalea suaedae]|uniref:TIGR03560 family F420-dependent LLM class oxidoreductase n=1 Tax=Pseudactinotalea suaedae TaxID=1524924 RepID=UPI0012E26177|nr:TIGR03560 family F420-dependent LLM class oxidoreductase [Pseudactinotalea suaedae]
MTLKYGLKLSQRASMAEYREFWQLTEDAGFDHAWVMDHFASIDHDEAGDIFEAWTMQAAMAVATSRVRIGCMVSGNTYRHPAEIAKMAVTVDHLSGGRLEFGFGAGWNVYEHDAMGLELGEPGPRLRRFEEAVQIVKSLWTKERTSFAGEHYTITDLVAEPKPVQQPVPFWIGGSGRRRTLRIVAQHADVWNWTGSDLAEFTDASNVLDGHCESIGRDPEEIRRSVQLRLPDGQDASLELVADAVRRGATEIIFIARTPNPMVDGDRLAAMLPRFRDLG